MRRRFRRRQAPSLLNQAVDGVAQGGDALGDVFRRKVAEGQAQIALASVFRYNLLGVAFKNVP